MAVYPDPEADTSDLKQEALTLKASVQNLSVVDSKSYLIAGQFAKDCITHQRKVVVYFADSKKAADVLHKKIVAMEKDALAPAKDAEAIVRKQISAYLTEQERLRREAQAKAEAIAAEAARKEQEKLLARAAAAEAKGKAEKAEELLEQAEEVYVAPVVIASAVEKSTKFGNGGGITAKKDIRVTITDIRIALQSIVHDKLPHGCIEFKLNVLKTYCKISGIKGGEVPGIYVEEISDIMIR